MVLKSLSQRCILFKEMTDEEGWTMKDLFYSGTDRPHGVFDQTYQWREIQVHWHVYLLHCGFVRHQCKLCLHLFQQKTRLSARAFQILQKWMSQLPVNKLKVENACVWAEALNEICRFCHGIVRIFITPMFECQDLDNRSWWPRCDAEEDSANGDCPKSTMCIYVIDDGEQYVMLKCWCLPKFMLQTSRWSRVCNWWCWTRCNAEISTFVVFHRSNIKMKCIVKMMLENNIW